MDSQNDVVMPKLVSIEVVKFGIYWKIYLRGVLLKKNFSTKEKALDYVPTLKDYFGDSCTFYIKESPEFDFYGKVS